MAVTHFKTDVTAMGNDDCKMGNSLQNSKTNLEMCPQYYYMLLYIEISFYNISLFK